MTRSQVLLAFTALLHFSNKSLVISQTCETVLWKIPIGEQLFEHTNIKTSDECCTLCQSRNDCTAFCYHSISEFCHLWNHTDVGSTNDPYTYTWIMPSTEPTTMPPEDETTTDIVRTTTTLPTRPPTTTLPTTTAESWINCPPTGVSRLPHIYDCTKYIRCNDSIPTEVNCQTDRLFDFLDLTCKLEEDAECFPGATKPPPITTTTTTTETPTTTSITTTKLPTTTQSPGQCPPNSNTTVEHPHDCRKYYSCYNGIPTEENCPGDFHYDWIEGECMEPEIAKCFPGSITTLFPSSTLQTSETSDISTVLASSTMITPSTNIPTTKVATTIHTSTIITTTEMSNICPPTGTIRTPHRYDCRKYFLCVEGIGEEKDCAVERLFDWIDLTCKLEEDAECFQGATVPPNK